MFTTVFFPSVLHLKADDTYLQLKKDLEYLDLKVSTIRGLTSLGHSLSESISPTVAEPQPETVQVCSHLDPRWRWLLSESEELISYSLRFWAQCPVNSAVRSLSYRTRPQDSGRFLSLVRTQRSLQIITGWFFRASSGVGASLVHRVPLMCAFGHK